MAVRRPIVLASGSMSELPTGDTLLPRSGTVFPTAEHVGQQFWRTDLTEMFVWDGTNWLGELVTTPMARNTTTLFPSGTVQIFGPAATSFASPHGLPNVYDTRLVRWQMKSGQSLSGDLEIYYGATLIVTDTWSAETARSGEVGVDLAASTTNGIHAQFVESAGVFEDVVLELFRRRRFTP